MSHNGNFDDANADADADDVVLVVNLNTDK
jgi:hypothetical protein